MDHSIATYCAAIKMKNAYTKKYKVLKNIDNQLYHKLYYNAHINMRVCACARARGSIYLSSKPLYQLRDMLV
mgnify:CR=1 FL=1